MPATTASQVSPGSPEAVDYVSGDLGSFVTIVLVNS